MRKQACIVVILLAGAVLATASVMYIRIHNQCEHESTLQADQLFRASETGDTIELQKLLDSGLYVDATSSFGIRGNVNSWTALFAAARFNQIESLRLLLSAGANPDFRDSAGRTPMHYAAENGHEAAIAVLIAHGGNVNALDTETMSPLYIAVAYDYVKCVQLLCKSGADVSAISASGYSPLTAAVVCSPNSSDMIEVVRILLSFGADPTRIDPCGASALRIAHDLHYSAMEDELSKSVKNKDE